MKIGTWHVVIASPFSKEKRIPIKKGVNRWAFRNFLRQRTHSKYSVTLEMFK